MKADKMDEPRAASLAWPMAVGTAATTGAWRAEKWATAKAAPMAEWMDGWWAGETADWWDGRQAVCWAAPWAEWTVSKRVAKRDASMADRKDTTKAELSAIWSAATWVANSAS